MADWWTLPVSQGFGVNNERGVDLGTPFHTPVTALFGGKVDEASCGHPWGCEVGVDANVPGLGNRIEYFLHLDTLNVQKGQTIAANAPIGLSGGQLKGGQNPNYGGVSTGPHLEVGFFQGGWWGPSKDPLAIVRRGPGTGGPSPGDVVAAVSDPVGAALGGLGAALGAGFQGAGDALGKGITSSVTNTGHGIAGAITTTEHNAQTFMTSQALVLLVAAVVVIVVFMS